MRKILNSELGRPSVEQFADMPKMQVAVVLDNIRSANNVGSFFRTCDAFAACEVVLCGISATPPSREIHKSALGAELTVPWRHFATTLDAVHSLRSEGYTIVAVEQVEGALSLENFPPSSQRYALVFGNEVDGVDQQVVSECDMAVEIPQAGTKHSLNVAVSGGVVLWQTFSKLYIK